MSLPQKFDSIPTVTDMFGAKVKQLARFCEESDWSAFNPSICYTEEHGYLVLFRSSNGVLKDHREEHQTEVGEELTTEDSYSNPGEWYQASYINSEYGSEKLFRNRMFIAKLNPKTLTISDMKEVDLTEAYEQLPFKVTRGIEDGRLYHDGESLRVSATYCDFGTSEFSSARICSLKLDMSGDTPKGVSIEIFDSPIDEETVEKNWMPVHKTSLYDKSSVEFDFLYSSSKTYTTSDKTLHDVGGLALPLRGGSQLIGLENGTMLAITHQCVSDETIRFSNITKPALFRRRYVHRFIQYNEKGQILKVTDKFNLINKSMEFAAGMTINDGKVLVSFGALDCTSHVASIPLKNILSALRLPNIS